MDDFNPFAGLDKSRFPKGEATSEKDRRKTPKVRVQQVLKEVDAEDEEALFLNAVSSVRPLADEDFGAAFGDQPMPAKVLGKRGKASKKAALNTLELAAPEVETTHAAVLDSATRPANSPAESATDFAALVNLTLPSAAHDKRPALFREQSQTRVESVRDRSRKAVQQATSDAAIARLTSPDANDPAVFLDAMSAVTPLSGKGRDINPDVPPPVPVPVPEENPLQDFMDGKLAFTLASTDEYVEGHVVGLDLMLVSKLQNGQFSPEAHLDLHGLNAAQAFQVLVGFMRAAYLKGHRTVLVVPGRGKNSLLGVGVLREKIQEWFTQEPFKRVILAFCTARSVDGGTGALYVLLRKYKKTSGKVYWDRRPADPDLV